MRPLSAAPSSFLLVLLLVVPVTCKRAAAPRVVAARPDVGRARPISPAALSDAERGVMLLEALRYGEAAAAFEKATQAAPESREYRFDLALARYYQSEDLPAARAALSALVAEDKEDPAPVYALGHVLLRETRFDEARAAFAEARRRLGRDDPHLFHSLGLAARGAGARDDAIAAFRRSMELAPLLVSASYALGRELIEAGREAESAPILERFERDREARWAETWAFRYRAMGDLLLARLPRVPIEPGARPALAFAPLPRPALPLPSQQAGLEGLEGLGAALFDADGDGDLDLLELAGTSAGGSRPRLLLWEGEAFAEAPGGAGFGDLPPAVGLATGDLDADGDVDVVVSHAGGLALFEGLGGGRFSEASAAWGLRADGWLGGVSVVDYDHDGDLDVAVSRIGAALPPERQPDHAQPAPGLLFENRGPRRLVDVSVSSGYASISACSFGSLWYDVDHDNDVDALILDARGPVRVLLNQRDGTFDALVPSPALPLPDRVVAGRPVDVDHDGALDLVFTRRATPPIAILRALPSGAYTLVTAPSGAGPEGPGWGVAELDASGSGRGDLLVAASDGVWRLALEGDAWTAQPERLPLPDGFLPRGLLPGDVDRNGSADLIVIGPGGAWPLANRHPAPRGWLRLHQTGTGLSSREGQGSVVEAWIGPHRQIRYGGGGGGLFSADVMEVLLGFGDRTRIDALRITWPSGVRQPMIDLPADGPLSVTERGLKSSCPLLFAWDGVRHRFISDLLGAAALGLELVPGQAVEADRDELIVLPEGVLATAGGEARLRLVEHLEEMVYLDHVSLLVVDHPAGSEVVARERYQVAPPRDPTGLISLAHPEPPRAAWDERGNSVAELLAERDGVPVESFELSPLPGFARPHALILDLGDADPAAPVLLALDGWVRYASIGEMEIAAASGVRPMGPTVEVRDADGTWRLILSDAGMPAGLPKGMVLDLTGAFRSRAQTVRISTNLPIYWDRVRVDRSGGRIPLAIVELSPRAARLWRSDYPMALEPFEGEALTYDGDAFVPRADYVVASGWYTRLGDVTELLAASDDRLVVHGHGEALDLRFDTGGLPPPAPDRRRTFAVRVDGWMKDQEPGTVTGMAVEPLPTRTSARYPVEGRVQTEEERTRDLRTRWRGANHAE